MFVFNLSDVIWCVAMLILIVLWVIVFMIRIISEAIIKTKNKRKER